MFRVFFRSKSTMRVVGLVSGGKDSIYNILQCISAAHDVVALANIQPEPTLEADELDSFMFQTVGHEGIALLAEAAGLPLFRQTTLGKSHCQDLSYRPTPNDEVEDLFALVSRVKDATGCEGVAVGAIASDYQRTRVENVCSRLGLTSLAYMWQQDQATLLRAMIQAGINAVTVKVASMGLQPQRHLGISLADLEPIVTHLNGKYGVNICGEGGEYETFVLDCPLFHKKIILEETEIHQDSTSDIAASGHLLIKSARLEAKFGDAPPGETWNTRRKLTCDVVPLPVHYVADCIQDIPTKGSIIYDTAGELGFAKTPPTAIGEGKEKNLEPPGCLYVHNVSAETIEDAISNATSALRESGLTLPDIACVGLWLRDMADFAQVNSAYVKLLPGLAPARACVATPLPADRPILLELTACRSVDRKVVHVQSVSHWAPANIGPYSQCVKVGGVLFVAGQIPLVMGSMQLLEGPLSHKLRLSLRHAQRVLQAAGADLSNAVQVTVFVAKPEDAALAVEMLRTVLPDNKAAIAGVAVTALPRLADVEVLVVASELAPTSNNFVEEEIGDLKCRTELSRSESTLAFACHVERNGESTDVKPENIEQIIASVCSHSRWEYGLRILFNSHVTGIRIALEKATSAKRVTIVPVVKCEGSAELFTIIGLGRTS